MLYHPASHLTGGLKASKATRQRLEKVTLIHALFDRISILDVMRDRQERLRNNLTQISQAALSGEQLAENITKHYQLEVPVLEEVNVQATTKEIDIDVSQDPQRFVLNRYQPLYLRGTEVTVHLPYHGDGSVFDFQPLIYNTDPPLGEFDDSELRLIVSMIETRDIKRDLETFIVKVKNNLDNLRQPAEQLREQLLQLARALISERKQRIAASEEMVARLGIPIRRPQDVQDTSDNRGVVPATPAEPMNTKRSKRSGMRARWDFFICHASEDQQEIARPLADALMSEGLRVWYSDFSLKVGDPLTATIDRGLNGSRFGIVIISAHFFEKRWPQQELNGLVTREVEGKNLVLPVWHGVDFEEVRANSPTLAGRLAVKTDKGLDYVMRKLLEAAGL